MLNLDKLNTQIDINNIDPSQIIKLLTDNQKIIAIVIAAGALIIAVAMFNGYRAQDTGLRTQMSQAQGKLDAIKARDKAVNDLSSFRSSIPKELTVFDLITLISNYARSNDTIIVSYTPSQSRDMGLYDEIDVHFDVLSDNFKSMMLFLRKIERSKYPIVIHSWVGHENDRGRISFTMLVSAMLIHP